MTARIKKPITPQTISDPSLQLPPGRSFLLTRLEIVAGHCRSCYTQLSFFLKEPDTAVTSQLQVRIKWHLSSAPIIHIHIVIKCLIRATIFLSPGIKKRGHQGRLLSGRLGVATDKHPNPNS